MIQKVNPNTSKNESQLHQDLVHEVDTFQRCAKDIPHEPSKWFAKDITEFAELNTNSLVKWIVIAKKVTRSARRKMRQDKQQRLTKFFPLQITSRNNNITIESSTPPTSNMKQPSIITFFHPKLMEIMKERSA